MRVRGPVYSVSGWGWPRVSAAGPSHNGSPLVHVEHRRGSGCRASAPPPAALPLPPTPSPPPYPAALPILMSTCLTAPLPYLFLCLAPLLCAQPT
ncbi:hypothetical protein E2C01_058331 [Portunus trituberculatus]|uniref:Uncharacterized protein n=1 Tax=Portunus trituberculatus TaxID=210409 RepID=A0A5B7GW57_PORTR|nr:hypothetical protein [Portunus trituberculatus]